MKSRLQRNKEKISIGLLAFSGLLAVFFGVTACPQQQLKVAQASEASAMEWLGPITHYNGVVFGNFSSQRADVEGALAIGGEYAEFGTQEWYGYDIGAAGYMPEATNIIGFYENPQAYPSLLLYTEEISIGAKRGESVSGDNWYGVYGGRIVIPEGIYEEYRKMNPQFNGGHNSWATADDLPLTASETVLSSWFKEQYELANAATQQYANATSVTISQGDFSDGSYLREDPAVYANQHLKKNGTDETAANILVINVETGTQLQLSDPECLMPTSAEWAIDYDLIIYNFPDAQQVSAQGGAYSSHIEGFPAAQVNQPYSSLSAADKALRLALCSKVVWNFPAAEAITFTEFQLYGAVLAPEAAFEGNGGSLNGQLICNDFTQNGGFELHAYPLDEIAFEIVDPDEEEVSEGRGSFVIEKVLIEQAEQTEQFVFQITMEEQVFYGILEIPAGDSAGSIQFSEMEYGTYVVVECSTNWRYQQTAAGGAQVVRLTEEEEELAVRFVNEKVSDNWLSDHQRLTNKMSKSGWQEGAQN